MQTQRQEEAQARRVGARAYARARWLLAAWVAVALAGGCDAAPKPAPDAQGAQGAQAVTVKEPPATAPSAAQPAAAQPAAAQPAAAQPPKPPSALVEAAWLAAQPPQSVLVVDVRSAEAYARGHIEGASWLDVAALDTDAAAQTEDVKGEAEVVAVLGAAGIDAQTPVVLYGDAADYRVAARAFWILELHSHPAVAVLNGGYEGWAAAGLPTSTTPHTRSPTTYTGPRRPALLADIERVKAVTERGGAVVIDARSPSDYSGQTAPAAMPRKGHIPGALNIDVGATYQQADGVQRLPMPAELRALYEEALPAGEGEVITYCNGGRSASLSYLELRAAGREGVAVYDGSWGEWSSAEGTAAVGGMSPRPAREVAPSAPSSQGSQGSQGDGSP